MSVENAGFYDQELTREQLAALVAAGSVTDNEIVEGLYHGQALVRRNAAGAAALVDELPDPGHTLLKICARDADERVRASIVSAMAQAGYPPELAVEILFAALQDPVDDISDEALSGLELRLNRQPAQVIPLVVAGLRDPRPLVSQVCADLIVKAGERGVDDLLPLLGSADPLARRAAFDIFERTRWQALPQLVAALRDPNARPLAARLLGGVSELEPPLVAIVEGYAAGADVELAEAAELLLAALRRPAPRPPRTAPLVVPIGGFFDTLLDAAALDAAAELELPLGDLLYALRDGRDPVRANALGLLARSQAARDAASEVAADIAPLVRDPSPAVRRAACATLSLVGGPLAPPSLLKALTDPAPEVIQAAVDGLFNLGAGALPELLEALPAAPEGRAISSAIEVTVRFGEAAVQPLADGLAGALSAVTRQACARALGLLGAAAEEGLAALLRALTDPVEGVRAAAATAVGFVGMNDETILAALREATRDPVPHVRRQAAVAAARLTGRPLGERGAAEPTPIPIPGFDEAPLSVEAIASAVGELPLSAFIAKLKDGRALVRANAARAVGVFGERAAAAASALAVLLKDGDVEVRRAAVAAFAAMGEAALDATFWLLGALGDREPEVRSLAVEVLAGLHEGASEFLIEGLRVDAEVAAVTILLVFDRLEAAGVPLLEGALSNGSALIRLNAARGLERVARKGGDAALDALEARLADPVGDVRAAASDAIDAIKGGIPKPPVALEPDPIPIDGFAERALGAAELEGQTGATTVARLVRALSDGRPYIRQNAATLLGYYGPAAEGAVAPLAVALKDGAVEVRRAAAVALGRLGGDVGGPVASILVDALEDRAPAVVAAARSALEDLGDGALSALVEGLARPVEVASTTVLPILTGRGAEALASLAEALAAPSPATRASAARGLLMLGRELAEAAREPIARATRDPDDLVRREARRTLDHLDGKDDAPKALAEVTFPVAGFEREPLSVETLAAARDELDVDALRAALRDGRPVVRANAARALGVLGASAASAADQLVVLLRDGDVDARRAAIDALGALGEAAAEVAPWILVSLGDDDDEVRGRAIEVLAGLHGGASDTLIEGLRVDREAAERGILLVFYRLEAAGVPTLVRALKDGSGLIRLNAARALELIAKRGGDAAYDDLEGRLNDPVKAVQIAAEDALDAIKGGRPKPPVALEPDPVPIAGFDERQLDAELLAGQTGATSVARMLRALRDGRPFVRHNAATLLGFFGREAQGAVGQLAVALKDGAVDVRVAAAGALGRLGVELGEPIGAILVSALGDRAPAVREALASALEGMGAGAIEALIGGLMRQPDEAAETALPLLVELGEAARAPLTEALGDPSPLVRASAARGLLMLGRELATPAREALQVAARDADKIVATEARAALDHIDGRDDEPAALEAIAYPIEGFDSEVLGAASLSAAKELLDVSVLTAALNDGRAAVRANAAATLALWGEAASPAIWPLAVLLRDGERAVRRAALEALGAVGAEAAEVGAWVLVALTDDDPEIRERAVGLLAAYAPALSDVLIEGLRVGAEVAPTTILLVFRRLEGKGVELLRRALRHGSGLIRENAARALELVASKGGDAAADDLEERLADPVKNVRIAAADALDAIKGGRPKPIVAFEPDPVPIEGFSERALAPAYLAERRGATTVERLIRALRDGRPFVRHNAAVSLGYFGADAAPAVPALAVALKDSAVEVRAAVATALGALGAELGAPIGAVLVSALDDPKPLVTSAAAAALRVMGAGALDALIAGLTRPPGEAAATVAPLLVALGGEALGALTRALTAPSPDQRASAARALWAMGRALTEPVRDAVARACQDPEAVVRREAQRTLARIDGRDAAPAARDVVSFPVEGFTETLLTREVLEAAKERLELGALRAALSDGRLLVRANAASAIATLGAGGKPAAAEILVALKDGRAEVRERAARALVAMGPDRGHAFDLVIALQDASPAVVQVAEEGLVTFGDEAIEAYLYALDTIPSVAARSVIPMLVRLGDKAVDPLVAALSHPSTDVLINALVGLRMLGRATAKRARAAVALLGRGGARDVRLQARLALDFIDGVKPKPMVREPLPLPLPGFESGALGRDALAEKRAALEVATLRALLGDGRRLVRENACRGLEVLGELAPELGLLLKDSVAAVRLAAAEALRARVEGAGGDRVAEIAGPQLVSALTDPERQVRALARQTLVACGVAAWPALKDGLHIRPEVAVRTVIPVLHKIGAPVVPSLLESLDDVSAFIRLGALGALVRLHDQGVAAGLDKVEARLSDPLDSVRRTAQLVLDKVAGRVAPPVALEAVPMPLPGFDLRALDAAALKKAASAKGPLEPAWLVRALGDGRDPVRENAARALGTLGKRADEGAIAALVIALKDPHPPVRIAAAGALGALKREASAVVPALARAFEGADAALREALSGALSSFGPAKTVPVLMDHLAGRQEQVVAAFGPVAHQMPEAFVKGLTEVIGDEARNLVERENAVSLLHDLGHKARSAEEVLFGLLTDQRGMISVKAIDAMVHVATPGAETCERLVAHLRGEPRPSVHYAIRDAVRILRRAEG